MRPFTEAHGLPIWVHRLQSVGFCMTCRLSYSKVYGILVPWPGTESVYSALQGRFLTTRSPAMPSFFLLYLVANGIFVNNRQIYREKVDQCLSEAGDRGKWEMTADEYWVLGWWKCSKISGAKFCENTKIDRICILWKINFMDCKLYLHKMHIHRNVSRMIGTKCV